MTKAVLISNAASIYDDLPEDRYHFPRQYLKRMEAIAGDWIIYYESRRNGGRKAYYATAQIKDIQQDLKRSDHYYAYMANYLEFEIPVPFKEGNGYYETSLLKPDGTVNPGKAISAVRHITEEEYQLILQAGFAYIIGENLPEQDSQSISLPGFSEEQETFDRPITQQIINRPFRDQAFREAVRTAYDKTCAFTGLKLINGGGRPEVQAAHIRPVADKGPDSVRNGLALSGTVHWMFDRGLISLNDDYKIIKAGNGIPEAMDRLLLPSGQMMLPERPEYHPAMSYLKYHREQVFKC
ncbi:MAG: restriction endonuclease [bacterium]|nr:restriction endonuclease [bacterium]